MLAPDRPATVAPFGHPKQAPRARTREAVVSPNGRSFALSRGHLNNHYLRAMGRHRSAIEQAAVLCALAMLAAACSSDESDTAGSAVATSSSVSIAPDTATAPTTTAPLSTSSTSSDPLPTASLPTAVDVELGVELLVASDFAVLEESRVGLITNQVSMVDGRHLIDLMAEADNVDLVQIFAAEHGVRGVAGAGEAIGDGVDDATGIPIRSLYGSTRQPTSEMLDGIDTIVFDLQDVGTRYYTYTATMGLAMQAAAAANLRFVVLDRPNPLGRIVEGDLRTDQQTSFISQYPVPSLHGLTAGELALMIAGEAWLPGLDNLDLEIVPMSGWAGQSWEQLDEPWIPPSPGLQTIPSALTYPAVVWFEATTLSYGAGTDLAFQAVGAPWLDAEAVVTELVERSLPGVRFEVVELSPTIVVDVASDPRFEGVTVPGVRIVVTDVVAFRPSEAGLHLLEAIVDSAPDQTVIDRGAVFDLLAGSADVRRQLGVGTPVAEIAANWPDVAAEFRARSFAYLLY